MSRVEAKREGAVLRLVVGDGTRRNALGEQDWADLAERVRAAGADGGVGAIVLEGAQDTFSAGSDMREWADAGTTDVERAFATMEAAFRAVEDCPLPVVAAVEGVAAGAGCQLALAADLAVMADSARIGMPIARLGILASPAFAARVTDRVGAALAADLYLTGRLLSASEAHAVGVVGRVVPDGTATESALRLAASVAARPREAVAAAKAAIHAVTGPPRVAVPMRDVPSVEPVAFHDPVRRFLAAGA